MNSANPDQTIIKCNKIIKRIISDKCKVCQPEHRPDNYQVSSAKPKVGTPRNYPSILRWSYSKHFYSFVYFKPSPACQIHFSVLKYTLCNPTTRSRIPSFSCYKSRFKCILLPLDGAQHRSKTVAKIWANLTYTLQYCLLFAGMEMVRGR